MKARKITSNEDALQREIYLMGYDVWSEGHDVETYLNLCQESKRYQSGKWWVLENENSAVASLITYEFYDGLVGLASIACVPKFRGNGFASLIIRSVIEELKTSARVIAVHSTIGTKFYEHLGFRSLPASLQNQSESVAMVYGDTQWEQPLPDF